MNFFSSRLKLLRKENNITQTELSISLGYSRSTIAKYETGDRIPSGEFLVEVANYFKVSLDYLLGRSNIKKSNDDKHIKMIKSKIILIINPEDGKIIDCTPSALEFYGYTKKELLNKTIFEINVLSNKEINNLLNEMKTKQHTTYNFKHKIADGSIKDIDAKINIFNINNKRIVYAVIRENKYRQKFNINNKLIESLHKLSVQKIPYKTHQPKKVARLSCEIGKHLSLNNKKLKNLKIASWLKDIGEVNLPTYIVNKPDKLITSEYNLIKEHPTYSYNLIEDIPFDKRIGKIILQHHERIDGSGYPNGLYENEILIESKIIAVADVFSALIEKRPYRDPFNQKNALEKINKMKGKKYNNSIVNTLNHIFNKTNFTLSG